MNHKFSDNKKHASRAIIDALILFSDKQFYEYLINEGGDNSIEEKWFDWFIKEWRVARTINSNKKSEFLYYIHSGDFNSLIDKDFETSVDFVANTMKKNKWSAYNEDKKYYVKPTSLVSKIGFILFPEIIIPVDRYSKLGLNKVKGTKKDDGEGYLKENSYAEYIKEFNRKRMGCCNFR